jgi:serine/threonine protein kinase
MAPEQGVGDAEVDHRADLYALGVMAYEVLTSRLPFPYGSARAILSAHLCEAPPPPTRWRPDLPVELEAMVLSCLAKKPEERPSTARDAATTFARFELEA